MATYLQGLNEQQEEAVLHKDGPIMIIAGAGSGKTKVLTTRIAHLMSAHGIDGTYIYQQSRRRNEGAYRANTWEL